MSRELGDIVSTQDKPVVSCPFEGVLGQTIWCRNFVEFSRWIEIGYFRVNSRDGENLNCQLSMHHTAKLACDSARDSHQLSRCIYSLEDITDCPNHPLYLATSPTALLY